MQIIETISGATENTVVYEDNKGVRHAIACPKVVSVQQMLDGIAKAEKAVEPAPKKPVAEKSPNKAPSALPSGPKAEETIRTARPVNTPKQRYENR